MPLSLSILDLAPVPDGTPSSLAIRRTVELAQLGERLGYVRHWFAEHHGMPSVASAAPELLIAHAAGATQRIRVGSGGMMLPNHRSLKVVEIFRTLEAMFPGRIDLGVGRAPGSDRNASVALGASDGSDFAPMLAEMLAFTGTGAFPAGHPFGRIVAMPDDAPLPPIWILGSSGASARMAGAAGMGYSFASHFSDAPPAPAFNAYRDSFEPTSRFPRPHAILGVAVVCAETDADADRLASTMDLAWLRIRRGEFRPLPSPEEAEAYPYDEQERELVRHLRTRAVVGSPASVKARLEAWARDSGADEVMVVTNVHDHAERLRSYELLAQAFAPRTPAPDTPR